MNIEWNKSLISFSPTRKLVKRIPKLEKEIKKINKHHLKKKGIFITARVHPGEPQSSWVLQGFVAFLVSNNPVAQKLRK